MITFRWKTLSNGALSNGGFIPTLIFNLCKLFPQQIAKKWPFLWVKSLWFQCCMWCHTWPFIVMGRTTKPPQNNHLPSWYVVWVTSKHEFLRKIQEFASENAMNCDTFAASMKIKLIAVGSSEGTTIKS